MMIRTLLFALALSAPAALSAQTHAPIEDTPPEPGIVQGCGYYTIIGSARSLGGAFDFQDHLGAIGSGVIDNDNVAQFRDGFHSIVFGPFGVEAMAEERATSWRDRAPDAYVKFGCVDMAGGPLPLVPGAYVLQAVACSSPPNAALRFYEGAGISGSATRNCTFSVDDQEGNLFGGSNSCENTYDGSRSVTALSVRVLDPTRFRLAEEGTVAGIYRRCADLDPNRLRN